MAWQRGQDHDGLLEGSNWPNAPRMKRRIPEFHHSVNSEIGHIENDPQPNDCGKYKPIIDIDLHR